MKLLNGKIALVTGGAAGLGLAITERFADAGACGLCLDTADAQGDVPKDWLVHRGDVSDEGTVKSAVAEVMDHFGALDIVVANAGIAPPWRGTADIDMDEWDAVFAVNVRGVMTVLKHASSAMQNNGGSIIVMGSVNSVRGHAPQSLYVATKHAVLGIVRSAALDLGRQNIRVNALGPGPVATDALVSRARDRAAQGGPGVDETLHNYAEHTAMGRLATEREVANAALFLASSLSSGITGQFLPVDAGLS